MKSTTKKEQVSFACDDLPMPVIIYRQDNGKILKFNKLARKLFALPLKAKTLYINKIRPGQLPKALESKHKNNFIDYGLVSHQTLKGKEIFLNLLHKSITLQDTPCCVDFLEEVNETISKKNEIIQTSLDAFVSMGEEQAIIDWNSSAEKIFGWKKAEVIGRHLVDVIIPKQHSKQHLKGFNHYLKTGEGPILGRLIEMTAIHKKGHEFPIELTVNVARENGRKIFYSFIRDISDRKMFERTLSQNEYNLKRAQSIASIGSWEMYGNFSDIHWSDEFYRIHGLQPQSVKPSTRLRLSMVHPKDRIKLQKAIDDAAQLGKRYSIEKRIVRPNGEMRWVLSQGETSIDPLSGKRKVFGTLLDISERKNAEAAQRTLTQSLNDFENAIQSSSIVSRADRKGTITYVNGNFVKISGYKEKELIGRNHRIINSSFHPKSFWVEMWKTISGGKMWRAEVKNKAKDGSYYWVDTFIMPFLDEKGMIKEFLSIRNDITLRKESEDALEAVNASLTETLVFGKMGSAELNLHTFQLTVSKELWQLLDVKVGEPKSIPVYQFLETYVLPGYLERIREKIREGLAGLAESKKVVDVEFEMTTVTGRNIWIEAKGIFKGDSALGILQDVTERKKIENEVVSNSKKIGQMLEGITDGFFATDPALNFTMINPIFAAQAQLKAEDMVGKNMLELFPHLKGGELITTYQKALQSSKSATVDRLDVPDKNQIFQINVYPNAQGLFVYYKDITRAVREREVREELLDRLEKVSYHLPGFIYQYRLHKDGSSHFPYASAGIKKIYGITAEEAQIDAVKVFTVLHKEDLQRVQESIKRSAETMTTWSDQYRIHLPDGEMIWVEGNATPRREEDESVLWHGYISDITERKKSKEAIEKSESYLRAILNASTDSTAFIDVHGKVRVINKKGIERIQRFHNGEILNETFITLLPEPYRNEFRDFYRKALQGESVEFEREVIIQNRTSWMSARYLPVYDNQNQIIGVSQNVADISDRKLAELALKESEERYKRLYNNTPAMLYSIDKEGKIIRVSDYWLQKMEYTRDEVIGRKSIEFLTEESSRKAEHIILPYFYEKGSVTNIEYDYVTKSGKILNTLLSATAEFDSQRRLEKSLSVVTDITGTRKLEKEIQRLALIASRTNNAVIFTDREGRITWLNDGFEKITGYSKEESIGKKPGVFLQGAETNPTTISRMREAIQKGEGFRVELLNYKKNGKVYWLDIECMPINDEHGSITGFMAIESDITELKLAVQEMLNSQTRLQTIMDNSSMVVFMKDLQGRYIFYNHAFQEALKVHPLKSGDTDYDFFDKEIADEYGKKDSVVLGTESTISYETTVNGKQYYVTKFPIQDQQGRLYALGGISLDISQHKADEMRLKESEERFSTIAKNIPNGAIYQFHATKNGEYSFPFITEGVYSILGVRANEIILDKNKLIELAHPDDIQQFQNEVEKSAVELSEFHNTARFKDKQGNYHWLTGHSRPKRLPDGSTLWDGVLLDETSQKITEEALQKSQLRLQAIFDNAINSIILADDQGNYLDGNFAACNMLGYTLQEFKELNVSQVVLPETIKADPFNEFLRKGQQAGVIDLKTKSGNIITARYNAVANILPGLHLSILEDITEKNKAEKELIKTSRLYEVTSNINQMMVRAKNKMEVYHESCRVAVEHGQFRMAWVGLIDQKSQTINPIVSCGHVDNYFENIPKISTLDIPSGQGPSGRAVREKRTVINNNIADESNLNYNLWKEEAMKRGYGSSIALPIIVQGNVTCVYTLYKSEPFFFTDKEIQLLEKLTGNIAFSLHTIDIDNERKKNETALRESEERFRLLIRDLSIGILLQGPQSEIELFNEAATNLLGVTKEALMGRSSFSPEWNIIHEDGSDYSNINQPVPQVIATRKPVHNAVMGVYRPINRDRVWLMVDAIPRLDEEGNVKNVICTFNNITKLKDAEVLIRESESRLRSIIQTEPNCIKLLDTNGDLLEMNAAGLSMIEADNLQQVLKHKVADIVDEQFRQQFNELLKSVTRGASGKLEFSITGLKGTKRWLETFAVPLKDERRNENLMLGITRDITEQKNFQDQLLASLHEKEILIKEIHHRVKNNLQLISSIIYVKMRRMREGEFKDFLEETRQKIRAIALTHERLLQTGSVDQVNTVDYLGKLIVDLQMTSSRRDLNIQIQSDIDAENMSLDTAIYCGLIINELVTNSIKHAFDGRTEGLVEIALHKSEIGFLLEVRDNGISLPTEVELGNSNSFGLQMLDIFIKQLGGSVKIDREGGTCFTMTFRDSLH